MNGLAFVALLDYFLNLHLIRSHFMPKRQIVIKQFLNALVSVTWRCDERAFVA
jgi:hypothetical protein